VSDSNHFVNIARVVADSNLSFFVVSQFSTTVLTGHYYEEVQRAQLSANRSRRRRRYTPARRRNSAA
jgi:hypothetical protein